MWMGRYINTHKNYKCICPLFDGIDFCGDLFFCHQFPIMNKDVLLSVRSNTGVFQHQGQINILATDDFLFI